tara:strand:+ start:1591 stop:1845 length:255 start_codon:yes stop_codon:yes gene_type:complete
MVMKFKEYYNEAQQIALPGMRLPDEREGRINILTNQLVGLYMKLYQDKERVVSEIIQSLKKADMVEYQDDDAALVINIVNKKMR